MEMWDGQGLSQTCRRSWCVHSSEPLQEGLRLATCVWTAKGW